MTFSNPNPTYAICVEAYADNDNLFYVYTFGRDGCRKVFAEGDASFVEQLAIDLRKLQPSTVAILCGDE